MLGVILVRDYSPALSPSPASVTSPALGDTSAPQAVSEAGASHASVLLLGEGLGASLVANLAASRPRLYRHLVSCGG